MSMTSRQRLMATLRGELVDRPAVSFYEIDGLDQQEANPDPFNIYSDPSWKPLLELARTNSDRIVRRGVPLDGAPPDPFSEMALVGAGGRSDARLDTFVEDGCRHTVQTYRIGGHTYTTRTKRDPDLDTVWVIEHLLKNKADLEAYLALPAPEFGGTVNPAPVLEAEARLAETGIVMIEMADPLCMAASLFDMADYLIAAVTEPVLFRQLLDRFAAVLYPTAEAIAEALPGRLWRVYGAEYAVEPYLPPSLFREFVAGYTRPIIESIQRHGGYARLHCHGRIQNNLDSIASLGVDGLDPIEPPPQGDVELRYVRENYGETMVLFGNLEVSDIETLPTPRFTEKVKRALEEGTSGEGRGFVLMPSSCPCGRHLSDLTMRNYEAIIEVVEGSGISYRPTPHLV